MNTTRQHFDDYLRCTKCGWVHVAESDPSKFLGDLAEHQRCFKCHAPITALESCAETDAPRGVTLQGVYWKRQHQWR